MSHRELELLGRAAVEAYVTEGPALAAAVR